METRQLERILIIILALLDLFLAVVVLGDRIQAANGRRGTEQALTALLSDSGIEVAPGVDLLRECPPLCTVTRDLELEQRRVQALLGVHTSEDMGGSIWFYTSDMGQMRMRGTGELDLVLTGDAVSRRGRSLWATATDYFTPAGLELLDVFPPAEPNKPVYCCAWNGCPVFNAALTFDFSGDALRLISGTVVFNAETERSDTGMDAPGVLVRFMDLVNRQGYLCSRLEGLRPGYILGVTVSGESELTPVWRIETDTGVLYINAVSGEPETLHV